MNDIVLFSKNSKEYQKLQVPWEQKNYNVLLTGNKSKDDRVIRVNMNKSKIENTFYTALLYGIKLNGMLDDKKKEYVEKTIQDYVEGAKKLTEVKYFDSKIVSEQFLTLFRQYIKDKNEGETIEGTRTTTGTTKVQVLKLIYNLFQDEEIQDYFEGTFGASPMFEKEEDLKEILVEIFEELKREHIEKINKLRSYTKDIQKNYNTLIDNNYNDFLVYFFEHIEKKKTQTIDTDTLNLENNLKLYYALMKADQTLPNLVIINSETLRLESLQSFEKDIDPNRKCIVLFYFQDSNEFERLVYETYLLPPFTFVENQDFILKKRQKETFYRVYQFPYEHRLIQDLGKKV